MIEMKMGEQYVDIDGPCLAQQSIAERKQPGSGVKNDAPLAGTNLDA